MRHRAGSFFKHALIVFAILTATLLVFSLVGGRVAVGNLELCARPASSHTLPTPSATARVANPGLSDREMPGEEHPKNLVLFIGDGMGIGHISVASALLSGPGSTLTMTDTPFVGLMRTWAWDNLVTDSGAAATAMGTGRKTRKRVVGILPDGRAAPNIFEAARAGGLATGAVTTAGLAAATPAGFMVHAASRDDYAVIFEQMLDSGSEVLIGGDWTRKVKAQMNGRYMEMIDNAEALGAAQGYTVVRDPADLGNVTGPLLALFPARSGSRADYGPPLAVSTRHALRILSREGRGFLLLVESEVTDESAHGHDAAALIKGVRELDEAVAVALEASAALGNTLILVTADHETGGLCIGDGRFDEGLAEVNWATDYHTSTWVPLFAFGPGAELFTGVLDNTELAQRMAEALGLETLPGLAELLPN